jgi:NAD(P)-dependent dehydrogenase (short-subunit alcohol dehydrogenase family)
MLADHDAIDMLVNNAGRSIRRSIALSYDRFHDFERTMALNYFAPVRLVLRLLPHMTERRFGHIVNVSSIGVQANPPRFSAYVASKSALDAFSRVAATEMVGHGVTFPNIHMPLVRTPMIAPTGIYDRFPTLSPEQAAGMIVGALEDKPKHVGTTLGTVAVVATALAPKLVDAVLHTASGRALVAGRGAGPASSDRSAGGRARALRCHGEALARQRRGERVQRRAHLRLDVGAVVDLRLQHPGPESEQRLDLGSRDARVLRPEAGEHLARPDGVGHDPPRSRGLPRGCSSSTALASGSQACVGLLPYLLKLCTRSPALIWRWVLPRGARGRRLDQSCLAGVLSILLPASR